MSTSQIDMYYYFGLGFIENFIVASVCILKLIELGPILVLFNNHFYLIQFNVFSFISIGC